MSKKAFKSQASSARAASGAFGGAFGSELNVFGGVPTSVLSYVYEPPDLSGFSNPGISVAFKNLQKRDSTTKSKALEELQNYVGSLEKDALEEAALEAWIKVYPRTSIDNSRRVRQLAHTLQGHIAIACGKRLAKHMPSVAPSWLAGLYDPDTAVNRAALESFKKTFTTEEKRRNVWRAYHGVIIEYTRDVVAKETENTLSDTRITSPDDAATKYARTAGCAVTALSRLLEIAPKADVEKFESSVDVLLHEDSFWKLSNHADAFARRSVLCLLLLCLDLHIGSLAPSNISAQLLTIGLHTDQRGSVLDYIKAIERLSENFPTIWTTDYHATGKKSALNRLRYFLRKGSQGGSGEFWTHVPRLIEAIPKDIILARLPDASPEENSETIDASSLPVLEAIREGINNKDELRTSSASAWNAYLSACDLVMSIDKNFASLQSVRGALFPLVHRYVRSTSSLSPWMIIGAQQKDVCARACGIAINHNPESFEQELRLLSSKVIEDCQTSLPEQSKDFNKSQDFVIAEAERWYGLEAALIGGPLSALVAPIIKQVVASEIVAAISLVRSRNGKPYGSAALLITALELIPNTILAEKNAKQSLLTFVDQDVPRLVTSPSAQHLIRLLDILDDSLDSVQVYANCMQSLEGLPDSPAKYTALETLFSSSGFAKAGLLSATRNKSISRAIEHAVKENDDLSWNLLMVALDNASAPEDLTEDVLNSLTNALSIDDSSRASLHGLDLIVQQDKTFIRDFAVRPMGSNLMSKLLYISDDPEPELSQQAKRVISEIEGALATASDISQTTQPQIKVIQKEFDVAGPESLSIHALVGQAYRLLNQAKQEGVISVLEEILPTPAQWTSAINVFASRPPNPSLGVTNALGGAIAMIHNDQDAVSTTPTRLVSRDGEGRSVLLRILQYVTKVVRDPALLLQATEDLRFTLMHNLALTLQLAGDDISVSSSTPLWFTHDSDAEVEIAESIFDAQRILAHWSTAKFMSDVVSRVQDRLLQNSKGDLALSYYNARAFLTIHDQIAEVKGHVLIHNEVPRIKVLRKSQDIFADMAILMASDIKYVTRACNGLLSELTTHNFDDKDQDQQLEGLQMLLLLNCLLQRPDDLIHDIPQQRLVFFVQHVTTKLGRAAYIPATEIMRSLVVVLPAIKEIYGSFWADVLDCAMSTRQYSLDDEHLASHYTSLRLFNTLRKSDMLEANDDLDDAWTERKQPIMKDLVELLEQASHLSDESNSPRRIFNELLSRLLAGSSQILTDDVERLLPVMASDCLSLQQTAYELLHDQIPSRQEQASLDKALTKEYEAKLPEELLSLILGPPTLAELSEASFERAMPASLRSYLLSWMLIFDHWKNASNVLQADYAKSLTEGAYLKDLLDLAFNILIGARSKPVDASKFDVETYVIDVETPERDTHWLLIHLYFLCLKYLPIQSKIWWRDTTNRQTNIAVEAWTQKYISKLIIASELESIREWAPTQMTGDQALTIKVSSSAREINASIPVDEQTMVLVIRLPPAYPLARAEVEGVHRVGVPEKKWTSWIRNAQGQLTIASEGGGNALIDCLLAWRKNVTAAMKGQSECAICYSVVGADRTLPSKVCKTCKNKFHGSCLFRWFSSSNSSSCPLCRNTFTYS